MDTLGRHILCELTGCDSKSLVDVEGIRSLMVSAARVAKAEVRESVFHQFFPEGVAGVSGVVVLSESHIAIHTWPERRYAAIDVYTCGERTEPLLACEFLAKMLRATSRHVSSVVRGIPRSNGQYAHLVTTEADALAHSA